MKPTIKDVLDWYYDNLPGMSLKSQLEVLKKIAKNFTGVEIALEVENDRDRIEVIQETYSFIYCFINKLEYENFKAWKYLDQDKYLNWIADYKIEHFADEIFSEFGLEILKKRKDGFVVKDITDKKFFN